MSQDDPMSLFTQSFSKKKNKKINPTSIDSASSKAQATLPSKESSAPTSLEEAFNNPEPLPENWREKIAEMCHKLNELRALGAKIPGRHHMSEHEFEAFVNNPANFKEDDWEMISAARKRTKNFVAQMKEVLNKHASAEKKPKRKKQVSRSWISVD